MIIFLSILAIAVGVFAFFFPKHSEFFFSYNFTAKKAENIYYTDDKDKLLLRKIKAVFFVLMGLFFLVGAILLEFRHYP